LDGRAGGHDAEAQNGRDGGPAKGGVRKAHSQLLNGNWAVGIRWGKGFVLPLAPSQMCRFTRRKGSFEIYVNGRPEFRRHRRYFAGAPSGAPLSPPGGGGGAAAPQGMGGRVHRRSPPPRRRAG